ncbi:MAG: penicillin-binding protein [Bryobacteraceae bacterium]
MRFPVERLNERRLRIVAGIALLWAIAIAGRLCVLQIVQHKELKLAVESQQQRMLEIPVLRGEISDRTGHLFAVSIPTESVAINPQKVASPEFFAGNVAATLGLNAQEVRGKIEELRSRKGQGRGFLLLKRHITPEEEEGLRRLPFKAVEFLRDARREYPNGRIGAHVVGSIDAEGNGNSGIEQKLNADLHGRPGRMRVLTDSLQDPYITFVSDPGEQGANVTLTIHNVIQHVAERALEEGIAAAHAEKGSVVVMDPTNGEILALANSPNFDPSDEKPTQNEVEARLNTAVQAPCEPGSVMKMITLTMGLESRRFTPDTPLYCENGVFARPGRKPIHDVHRYGTLDAAHVLIKSSNIGIAKISIASGPRLLYEYLKKFGIGDRTHIELPGETGGILWPLECGATNSEGRPMPCWSASSHEYIAFGHEVEATAVQLARAVAVIANGGLLVPPHVVLRKGRPRADGTLEALPRNLPQPTRAVKAETAVTMRRIMERVVLEGTGRRAHVPGYTIGGKTGSAQMFIPGKGWVNRHNSSFIGFGPVNNPRIVVVVTLNNTPQQGGIAAAPVFEKIAETALRVLQVPKDDLDNDIHSVPRPAKEVNEAPEAPPSRSAADSETAVEQQPELELVRSAGRVYVAGPRVPDLRGKSMIAVMRESAARGMDVEIVGSGVAREQSPKPGTILAAGERIRVEFARPQ